MVFGILEYNLPAPWQLQPMPNLEFIKTCFKLLPAPDKESIRSVGGRVEVLFGGTTEGGKLVFNVSNDMVERVLGLKATIHACIRPPPSAKDVAARIAGVPETFQTPYATEIVERLEACTPRAHAQTCAGCGKSGRVNPTPNPNSDTTSNPSPNPKNPRRAPRTCTDLCWLREIR